MICFDINLDKVSLIKSEIGWHLKTKEPIRWYTVKLPSDISINNYNNFLNICVSVDIYRKFKLFRFDSRNHIYYKS